MVVSNCNTFSHILPKGAETLPHPLIRLRRISRASQRVALSEAWIPVQYTPQWSTATNTLTCFPVVRIVVVISVPHISLGFSFVMVPSWTLGPLGLPTLTGACKWFSLRSLLTRSLLVRIPQNLNLAQIFLYPSP